MPRFIVIGKVIQQEGTPLGRARARYLQNTQSIRISKPVWHRLRHLSHEQGKPMTELISEYVNQYFDGERYRPDTHFISIENMPWEQLRVMSRLIDDKPMTQVISECINDCYHRKLRNRRKRQDNLDTNIDCSTGSRQKEGL